MDPSSTTSGKENTFLQRAYALAGVPQARDLYDEWASSYDQDLSSQQYASPQRAVDVVVKETPSAGPGHLRILDAGCGTGLVGDCLTSSQLRGNFTLDGVDLSEGMLDIARKKGTYSHLAAADLNEPLSFPDASYDVVICVGTLTKAHVGPQVLDEFCRVLKKGGLVVATVHDEIWRSGGYEAKVQGLKDKEVVEVISTDEFGIIEGQTAGGRMLVLRRM